MLWARSRRRRATSCRYFQLTSFQRAGKLLHRGRERYVFLSRRTAPFVRAQCVRNTAVFLWDYLVTLDMEVNYVWGHKLSMASGLFILNRYTNLLITILELIEQAPFETPQVKSSILTLFSSRQLTRMSPEVCLSYYFPSEADELNLDCTAALRSYAYYSRCWSLPRSLWPASVLSHPGRFRLSSSVVSRSICSAPCIRYVVTRLASGNGGATTGLGSALRQLGQHPPL